MLLYIIIYALSKVHNVFNALQNALDVTRHPNPEVGIGGFVPRTRVDQTMGI